MAFKGVGEVLGSGPNIQFILNTVRCWCAISINDLQHIFRIISPIASETVWYVVRSYSSLSVLGCVCSLHLVFLEIVYKLVANIPDAIIYSQNTSDISTLESYYLNFIASQSKVAVVFWEWLLAYRTYQPKICNVHTRWRILNRH